MVLRLIRTVGFSAFSCSLSSYCSSCYPSRSWFDWCPARRGRACERVSVWALLHGLVEVSLFSVQCVRFWQWIVVLRCKHYLAWFCLLLSIRKHEFQNKEYGQTELYSSQMKFATREFWEAILTHRVSFTWNIWWQPSCSPLTLVYHTKSLKVLKFLILCCLSRTSLKFFPFTNNSHPEPKIL